MIRNVRAIRCRKRQAGAETVEFMITLLLFLIVFFLIIDMGVVMFNQGVVNYAARDGARQGSLYWVDPGDYDIFDPTGNIRMKQEMIDTAVDFFVNGILINPGKDAMKYTSNLPGAEGTIGSAPNLRWTGVSSASVTVDLSYPHDFMILANLLSVAGITLDAATSLDTEAEL